MRSKNGTRNFEYVGIMYFFFETKGSPRLLEAYGQHILFVALSSNEGN